MSNFKSIFRALMAGAAIGSLLGVLFSPDKGVNIRKKLCNKKGKENDGEALKDEFNNFVDDMSKVAHDKKDK